MRKKTMFLGLLGAGLMWMPASAILAAQMNNAAMSVQQNQGIKGTVVDATGETLIGASVKVAGTTQRYRYPYRWETLTLNRSW